MRLTFLYRIWHELCCQAKQWKKISALGALHPPTYLCATNHKPSHPLHTHYPFLLSPVSLWLLLVDKTLVCLTCVLLSNGPQKANRKNNNGKARRTRDVP